MEEYRYNLDRSSHKGYCPDCGEKRFVLYVDESIGEYLPEEYGRCDREDSCGYHLNPYQDGYAKEIWKKEQRFRTNWNLCRSRNIPTKPKRRSIPIPFEVLARTRTGYENNIFIKNLLANVPYPFNTEDIERVISMYHLGTVQSGYRGGAITFPFIDKENYVRAIQVKQFDKSNHTIGTDFLHAILEREYKLERKAVPNWLAEYNKNDKKVSCLFGEHLLSKYPNYSIALVEAPKTAIYGTLYFGFPDHPENLLWLAVYNLSSLNLEKCKVLKGRNVILFPDLSRGGQAFDKWSAKAKELEGQLFGTKFKVSNLLETFATQKHRIEGKDLADYIVQQDWRHYRMGA